MITRRTALSLSAALPAATLALPGRVCAAEAQQAVTDWQVVPARQGALDWRIPIAHARQGGWAAGRPRSSFRARCWR
ncbi:MAG: hypothetical protein C6Y20_18300 [Tagaea sp. CACIAM 22H2]|nr:hypothetical protein [Tagaea sp. CACIAM 22H2]